MLLNEAEKLYNKLVKDLVNEAIDDTAFGRGSALSSSPLLSSSLSDGTTTKDIMQNHTFHGCEKTSQI